MKKRKYEKAKDKESNEDRIQETEKSFSAPELSGRMGGLCAEHPQS